jgi:hypothetical protein
VIVISGALVLVALVLLILGITLPGLTYVYASIVVSLVSGVFLGIGILVRRGDKGGDKADDRAGDRADAPSERQPAAEDRPARVPAAGARRGSSVVVVDEPEPAPEPASAVGVEEYDDEYDEYDDEEIDPADDRGVIVVAGRPRYHAQGCRYLTGKQAETIHLLDAREEGFTACGVCKPDNVIAIEDDIVVVPAEEGVEPVVDVYDPAMEDEFAQDDVAEDDIADGDVAEYVAEDNDADLEDAGAPTADMAADALPGADATGPDGATAAHADPTSTAVLERPVAAGRSRRAPAKRSGSAAVADAPSPAATAAAGTSAAASRRSGTVVVIPDRGKFHRAECRYVRGVAGAETRSKTQAGKQGFTACGVCKP